MITEMGVSAHRVRGSVGVEGHEKVRQRDLFFDVSVRYDATRAACEDHLSEAVDYTLITDLVDEVVGRGHYHLIETIGTVLVGELLERLPMVEWVRVRIEKPQAIPTAKFSYVEMEKSR